jgi:hypothetical protein
MDKNLFWINSLIKKLVEYIIKCFLSI